MAAVRSQLRGDRVALRQAAGNDAGIFEMGGHFAAGFEIVVHYQRMTAARHARDFGGDGEI